MIQNDILIQKYTEHRACYSIDCLLTSPQKVIFISGSKDHLIKFWDISQSHSLETYSLFNEAIWKVKASRDGQYLAVAYDKHVIQVYYMATKEIIHQEPFANSVWTLEFLADDVTLVYGNGDGILHKVNVLTHVHNHLPIHLDSIRAICLDRENLILYTGSYDKFLKSINLNSFTEENSLKFANRIYSLSYNNKTHQIYVGTENGYLIILSNDLNILETFHPSSRTIRSIAISPSKEHFLIGSEDGYLRIYESTHFGNWKIVSNDNLEVWDAIFLTERIIASSTYQGIIYVNQII